LGAELGNYPNELLKLALAHAVGDTVEAACDAATCWQSVAT
jgi:hypothetical protein